MVEPNRSDARQANSTNPAAANQGIPGPGGIVLEQYVLLEQLSTSRTGLVYKAKHRLMGRMVAVKFLSPEAAASESLTARFQRAVKILSRLEHKNLLGAHEASQQKGQLYLVMEYVDGQDLRSMVKQKGPLAVETAVDYVRQAAAGLAHAHEQGVFHRNIKPGNLLVDRQGVVKIVGFGLAHIEGGGAFDEASIGDGLTRQGQVMGTYDYMAPEQALDSSKVDSRADIYSLGCTLHNLLTGRAPYMVKSPVQMVIAHRSSPIPSVRTLRPEVPEALDGVFQKMLAKQPEDRYGSMNEVIAALEAAISGASDEPSEAASSEPGSSSTMTNLRHIMAEHKAAEKAVEPPAARAIPTGLVAAVVAVAMIVLAGLVWLINAQRPPVARSKDRERQSEQGDVGSQPVTEEESFEARPREVPPEEANVKPKPPAVNATPDVESPKRQPRMERTLEPLLNAADEPEPTPKEPPTKPAEPESDPKSEPEPELLPIPDQESQRKATQLLRDTFQDDFVQAQSEAQKTAFARQLLKQAVEIDDDPVGRFVLLETVRKLAVEVHEAATAVEAVDLAARHYRIDPWVLKVETLTAISEGPHSTVQRRGVADCATRLTPAALEAGQFEAAAALNRLAMTEAVKIRDVPMIQQIRTAAKEVDRLLDLSRESNSAEKELEKSPKDGEANLCVGRFECLVQGNWDKGLPKLAAGSDQALRALAASDLAAPEELDQQVAVGDGWWELAQAESGTVQANLYARADHWYQKAAPKATGLLKTKLDKRLDRSR